MNKVQKTKLGNLIEFQRGYDLPKSNFVYGKYPVISSNWILGYHNEYKAKWPGITIGRSWTVWLPQYIETDFFPHNTSLFVKDFKWNFPKYIFYLLKTFGLNNRKSWSGVPTMNRNHLHPLIVLANLDIIDQQKIAWILSTFDTKIELNNKINTELEDMAKTLYDYWFLQFDFPNENSKPYKSSGGEMMWSDELKRKIPKGWSVEKLKEIFEFEKGIEPWSSEYLDSPINENCIKFFRVGDIEWESSVYVDSSNKKYILAKERDVIVTFDGSVGKLGFGLNGAFSGGLRKIYDKSDLFDNSLVYFIFRDERIIATIHKYATGSILLHASGSIDHLEIPFEKDVYLKFQEVAKPIFDQMVKNKQENQKLVELRNFLLPMLMNGQVVVE